MNFYLKSIVALLMVSMPQIAKADMNFIERSMFSDKAYAKEIEIKAYIITQEQACAALCDPPQQPAQLNNKDLYGKKTYLFLQVKNTGKKHAWGILACKVPRYHDPIKVDIGDLDNPKNYNIYLLHLGVIVLTNSKPDIPKISFEWDKLYTK